MAEELVSERKCAITMVAMVKVLDGPSHTPGAEEEMSGQALGLVRQAGLKEELNKEWVPAELQGALLFAVLWLSAQSSTVVG